jgi:putative transposase
LPALAWSSYLDGRAVRPAVCRCRGQLARCESRGKAVIDFYHRRLPHWQPPGATIFITYRLFGSLPADVILQLSEEKRRLTKLPPRPGETRRDRSLREGKQLFALADQALDTIRGGPHYLAQPDIALAIVENLFHHMGTLYRLWAFVVMPNHTHVLLEPIAASTTFPSSHWQMPDDCNFTSLAKITHALKSYTAKHANSLLTRSGTFWQEESYDHWIRSEDEFFRVARYIEYNPVKAHLADAPEKWQWSSASYNRTDDWECTRGRIPTIV